jgi:hypothetical protein
MDYPRFLTSLFEDGRLSVPPVAPLSGDEVRAAGEVLAEFEERYRLEMPAPMPPFAESAAQWAARRFYRACQLAVYRDEPEEVVRRELAEGPRPDDSPESHYSVDLVFRYLPDLVNFAVSASQRDPLVEHLRRWARGWPLSSVGMRDVGEVSIEGFADSRGLMRLYADRIILRADASRLSDGRARRAVQTALGIYEELAGSIGPAIKSLES